MRVQEQLLEASVSTLGASYRQRKLPVVSYSDTIGSVLKRLASAGQQVSALVLKESCATQPAGADSQISEAPVLIKDILGFIDLNIIIQVALRRVFEGNVVHHEPEQLELLATKFCAEPVGNLVDGGITSFHGTMTTEWALKGDENLSLQTLIRQCFLFTKPGSIMRPPKSPAKAIHHVAIYATPVHDGRTEDARLAGVLSQMDIVHALHDHETKDGGQGRCIFHKTVKELGLVGFCATDVPPSPSTTSSETSERHCLSVPGSRMTLVPSSTTTLEAFRRMCMHRDCGVGMLAQDGTLRKHLSAIDLKGLVPGSFHKLLMPVEAFLQQQPFAERIEPESAPDAAADERPAKRARTVQQKGVLTCQATSTLAEVVNIMVRGEELSNGANQVFVVDPDSKPLSAITVLDVLRVVVDSLGKMESNRGTPITPLETVIRTSGLLESATSCQSDRGVSACTSEVSIPQVEIQAMHSTDHLGAAPQAHLSRPHQQLPSSSVPSMPPGSG